MIPRSQIIGRLRDENFSFSKRGKHTEILRQHGTAQHIEVPLRDIFTPDEAGAILKQAGCTPDQIERFLKDCLKT